MGMMAKGKMMKAMIASFQSLIEDDTDQTEDGKNIFDKTGDGIGDRSLNQVHIIGDPGDEDAGGGFREEGKGKGLEMIVKFLPEYPR